MLLLKFKAAIQWTFVTCMVKNIRGTGQLIIWNRVVEIVHKASRHFIRPGRRDQLLLFLFIHVSPPSVHIRLPVSLSEYPHHTYSHQNDGLFRFSIDRFSNASVWFTPLEYMVISTTVHLIAYTNKMVLQPYAKPFVLESVS